MICPGYEAVVFFYEVTQVEALKNQEKGSWLQRKCPTRSYRSMSLKHVEGTCTRLRTVRLLGIRFIVGSTYTV